MTEGFLMRYSRFKSDIYMRSLSRFSLGELSDGTEPFLEFISEKRDRFFLTSNRSNQTNYPKYKYSDAQNPVQPVEITVSLKKIDDESRQEDSDGLSDVKGRKVILFVLIQYKSDHGTDDRDVADYSDGFSFCNCLIVHGIFDFKSRVDRVRLFRGLSLSASSQERLNFRICSISSPPRRDSPHPDQIR